MARAEHPAAELSFLFPPVRAGGLHIRLLYRLPYLPAPRGCFFPPLHVLEQNLPLHLKSACTGLWMVQAWLAGTAQPLWRKGAGRQAAPTSYTLPHKVYYKPGLFTAALYEGHPLFAHLYPHRLSHHTWLLLQRKSKFNLPV